MKEQIREKAENYDGWIDALYEGVRKGINKIPNPYVRNFVRGVGSFPFIVSMDIEIIAHSEYKYSFGRKLLSDMGLDKDYKISGILYLLGIYSSAIGLVVTAVYNPSVYFTIMGTATGLDAANYVEHKIRRKVK